MLRKKISVISLLTLICSLANLFGSIPPNPLISVGKTVFASPDPDKDKLVNGKWNEGWGNSWVSTLLQVHSTILAHVTILNVQRQIVKYEPVVNTNAIDVSDMRSGIYFVKLETGEIVKIIKRIKQ